METFRIGVPDWSIPMGGLFYENIKTFVERYGGGGAFQFRGIQAWSISIVKEGWEFQAPMLIFENVAQKELYQSCDRCHFAGWGEHLKSIRTYHFVIPQKKMWNNQQLQHDFLLLEDHMLHGVIHSTGFGHLLCCKGGSHSITREEIMQIWEQICTVVRPREISLIDKSVKKNMDMRLLYGVAYGRTWYGRWNYEFHEGVNVGFTKQAYERAIRSISRMELDDIVLDTQHCVECVNPSRVIEIIHRYKKLSCETDPLVNLQDLFRFMLRIVLETPQKFSDVLGVCGFSNTQLEAVANVVVSALRQNGSQMRRVDVRGIAQQECEDTELINHALKLLDYLIVDGSLVRRFMNPKTRSIEYTLDRRVENYLPECVDTKVIWSDIMHLYVRLLLDSKVLKSEVAVLLGSKHFTRKWSTEIPANSFPFKCRVLPAVEHVFDPLQAFAKWSGDDLTVSLPATVSDLIDTVQNAMVGKYYAMADLNGLEIEGHEELDGGDPLEMRILPGSTVRMVGSGIAERMTDFRCYQASVINCHCGVTTVDGQRMATCNLCQNLVHTGCNGVSDVVLPIAFLCRSCEVGFGFH